jgi:hypothetical protein
MFFLDDYGTLQPVEEDSLNSFEPTCFEQYADDEQVVYLAGGKGGKFKRKNPKGKDGKALECSLCGSEDHLIKQRSQNTSGLTHTQHKQQHQKSFPSLAPSASAYLVNACPFGSLADLVNQIASAPALRIATAVFSPEPPISSW